MKIACKEIGTWGILEVEGDVDSVHTKIFVDTLAEYLSINGKSKNLILDLTRADFLSIGVIRYVNQISINLDEIRGRLVIMGANDRIRRHFDIFVGLKNLKEINNVWEVIPLQMSNKLNEAKSVVLAESLMMVDLPSTGIPDQN
jgi:anti-anti-sigma factor